MFALFPYIRNITYYLMFATVLGMFAPAGKYKKFVSLVMGFVLLALILQPLARFGHGEIPITDWFSGIFPQEVADDDWERAYLRWRNTYLRGAFEDQLSMQLESLLSEFTVHSSEFTYSDDFSQLTGVWVTVSHEEAENRRVPFIRIQPVQVGQQAEACETTELVKSLIAEFYNLSKNHINVIVL